MKRTIHIIRRGGGSRQEKGKDEDANLIVHGAMAEDKENFKLVWQCQQLLSGFLANGYLSQVSGRLLSVIMTWYRELCTDLLAFTLHLRNTRKTSIRRPSVGSFSKSWSEKEGKRKGWGREWRRVVEKAKISL